MDRIERINAYNTWFQVGPTDVPFGGLDNEQLFLGVQTPKKRNFRGVNRHFKPILQKIQIPISSKLGYMSDWHKIWQADACSPTKRLHGWSYVMI